MTKHILIVDARFYKDLADELVKGASAELDAQGATCDRISLPGVFELAPAIGFAMESGKYDGYIALGVVVRGETSHYDYVCGENARGLTNLAIDHGAAIGYGVLTVENQDQAWVRAGVDKKNKGKDAAIACMEMINLKEQFAA
jgi:6,7-dimethyl-8-ribityllumazine synthase